jgi:xanthine dehydrogenase small subunit
VGLWVTKQHRELETVIYIGSVPELQEIDDRDDSIVIGAGVSYTDAMDRLGALYPDMGELIRRIGSVQIRNSGTIGGNIANGSPIGDSPPALIAVGASLVLRRGEDERTMALEDYFIDYGKQDLRPGEFVARLIVPKPKPNQHFRAYKLSKRFDQDISAVCGCFGLTIEAGTVTDVRICYGGMAATPKRAAQAERALIGKPWNEETVSAGMKAMERDYTPLSDMRASAEYRLASAKNLLMKAYAETTGDAQTRVLIRGSAIHAG